MKSPKTISLIFVLLISLAFLFLVPESKIAHGTSFFPPEEKIIPGNSLYPMKRFWEKLRLTINFSEDSKIKFQKTLLIRRLSELNTLVEGGNKDQLEKASQRFSYEAGVLKQRTQKNPEKYKTEVLSQYETIVPFLENLRDRFKANSTYWLSLQQNIDTLNILAQELK